ncbi:MAG: T9SS type A sorting domain-containing protein [Nonlabens sp.]
MIYKNKIKAAIYLSLLSFVYTTVAQTSEWQWGLNGGGMNDLRPRSSSYPDFERVTHIAVDGNNNSYFQAVYAGNMPSINGNALLFNDSQDVVLYSTDCSGNFRWKKEFGSSGLVTSTGLDVALDGSVYATGENTPKLGNSSADSYFDTDFVYQSNGLGPFDPGPHNNYPYLIKYDSNGVFQWVRFPQNGNQDIFESLLFQSREVFVGLDGAIHWLVQMGEGTHLNGSVTVPAGTDPLPWMVLRYDPNGNFLGKTDIPLENNITNLEMDFAYDPLLNRYLITANRRTNSDIIFNGTAISNSTFLASMDAATGAVLWVLQSNYNRNMFIEEIVVGDDSSIYLTGEAANNNGDDSFAGYFFDMVSASTGGGSTSSHFAIALNPDGTLKWGNNGDNFGTAFLGITSNAATVAVGGSMNTTDFWDGVSGTSGVPLGEDPAVVLLDRTDGSVVGIYQPEGTPGQRDEVTALATDSFGNFIAGGYMRQSLFVNGTPPTITKNGGSADFWVARLATTDCSGVPLSNAENKLDKASLSPNPTTGWVTIGTNATTKSVTLYDTLGRKVLEQQLDGDNRFNAGGLPQGIYMVAIQTENGTVASRLVRE